MTPDHSERNIVLAARLYEYRRTARSIFGDRYDERIAPYRELLRNVAAKTGKSLMITATDVSKTAADSGHETAIIVIMAALVDEVESVTTEKRATDLAEILK